MRIPLVPGFATAGEVRGWMIVPFAVLLLLIAVMPLAPARARHLWERYYPHVALGLAVIVAAYYVFNLSHGRAAVLHTAQEYISFISLIGSLFVIAGGIHLKVRGEATPAANVGFLAAGALLANFIGTTGASMVMIRPWIRMNRIRIRAYHVVFFIFVVSNVGGAITPIGDPPLFLGFLRGVPFFWLVDRVMAHWLVTLALLLLAFYWIDRRSFRHVPRPLQVAVAAEPETWRFDGRRNVLLLVVVIAAVFLPERFFLREAVMIAAAAVSYRLTPSDVHSANSFSFSPVREVAWLFVGIFATMMPALDYLAMHGQAIGMREPVHYYLASGTLSAVLDNAPTYLNFLQLAQTTAAAENPAAFAGLAGVDSVRALLEARPLYVVAISVGSVFFGAMTYIGNGPNFMVKSIAQASGVHVPTFFGYVLKFSLPILFPILAIGGWIFM